MVLARGTSKPLSMMLVASRMSPSPSANPTITAAAAKILFQKAGVEESDEGVILLDGPEDVADFLEACGQLRVIKNDLDA